MKKILSVFALIASTSVFAAPALTPVQEVQLLQPGDGTCEGISWNAKSRLFALNCGTPRLLDANARRISWLLPTTDSSLRFNASGTLVAAAEVGTTRVWDTQTGREVLTLKTGPQTSNSGNWGVAEWSADGAYLSVRYDDWDAKRVGIAVLDARTFKEVKWFEGIGGGYWTPSGDRLIVDGVDGIELFAEGSWERVAWLDTSLEFPRLSPDDSKYWIPNYHSGPSWGARIGSTFSSSTKKLDIPVQFEWLYASFSPNSNLILLTDGPWEGESSLKVGTVVLYDISGPEPREVWHLATKDRVFKAIWSPSGKTVILNGTVEPAMLVSALTGEVIQTLTEHASTVVMEFEPNGQLLSIDKLGKAIFWKFEEN